MRRAPRRGYGRSYGYGRRSYGYGRRHRRQGGFGLFGPFPYYSRRTRGGGRVSVGGCCLPIPLALTLGTGVAVRHLSERGRARFRRT